MTSPFFCIMFRLLPIIYCLIYLPVSAQELYPYQQNKTYTYDECISVYKQLAELNETASLQSFGSTDVGKPLHLFIISKDKEFTPVQLKKSSKGVLLINNGIHPGEPCGIDASVKLAADLLSKEQFKPILDSLVICIIPVYNIGGALNRGQSRVNQNGPEAYGFRGNYQNLDLNRDFVKADSKNAKAFWKIFHAIDPDMYIETHTTNGYDYQYSLGLIPTQPDKLGGKCEELLTKEILPFVYKQMADNKMEITPYVHSDDKTPEKHIKDFLETPRYSTGYAALFQTVGFITEAHKFKPFEERVTYTYQTMVELLKWQYNNAGILQQCRVADKSSYRTGNKIPVKWTLDTTRFENITFRGYASEMVTSRLDDNPVLHYNEKEPTNFHIKHYNHYKPTIEVTIPKYYVIPQAYRDVVLNLRMNKVRFKRLKQDTVMKVEAYYIENYKTTKGPFEKHYLHYDVEVSSRSVVLPFYKGDFLVPLNRHNTRFIVELLEPEAPDAYFVWNFFDDCLQQKEWFSDFAFDTTAVRLLKEDKGLRKKFEMALKEDTALQHNHWEQLRLIHKLSAYFEPSYMRYPVYRIME